MRRSPFVKQPCLVFVMQVIDQTEHRPKMEMENGANHHWYRGGWSSPSPL